MSVFFLSSSTARCELVHRETATAERCLPWRWAHKHRKTLLSAVSGFYTDFGILLPCFALSLPSWLRFAALGSKRKVTEPQEGTTYLYRGTNIKEAWFSKNHRARTAHTDPSAWTWTQEQCWRLLVLKLLARADAPSFIELLSDPYGQSRHQHTKCQEYTGFLPS